MRLLLASIIGSLTILGAPARAPATHNAPRTANKLQAMFVRAYEPCPPLTATRAHNPPLAFPACDPVLADGSTTSQAFYLHFSGGGVSVPGGTSQFFLDETSPTATTFTTDVHTGVPNGGTVVFPTFIGTPLAAPLTLPSNLCLVPLLNSYREMAGCADVQVDVIHVHANGMTTPVGSALSVGRSIVKANRHQPSPVSAGVPVTVGVTGDSVIPAGDSLAVTASVIDNCPTIRDLWQLYDAVDASSALFLASCSDLPINFGPRGFCQITGNVVLNSAKQATDVKVAARCSNIDAFGLSGAFTGLLTVAATLRITDHHCVGGGPCTTIDLPFPIPLPCGASAVPPLANGKCAANTSMNAVLSGTVVPGKSANVELGPWQIYNGSQLLFTEGIFLP